MYACKTWIMKKQTEQKLLIFERKIKLADSSWRIKTNKELYKLLKRKKYVREIKSRKTAWLERRKTMG